MFVFIGKILMTLFYIGLFAGAFVLLFYILHEMFRAIFPSKKRNKVAGTDITINVRFHEQQPK